MSLNGPIASYEYLDVKDLGIEELASSVGTKGPHAISLYANENFKR